MRSSNVVAGFLLAVASVVAQQNKVDELAARADSEFAQGKFAEAERAYLEVLKETHETSDPPSRLAITLHALATIYNLQGRYKEAEPLCRRALALVDASPGAIESSSILSTLASIEIHIGEYGQAEQNIRRAITIRLQYFKDHDPDLVAYYTTLGVVLCSEGRCKQANEVVQHALRLCETSFVDCQTAIATARTTLGAINVNLKRYSEAEEWHRGALDLLVATYGPSNAVLVPTLAELASLHASRNRYAEAAATGRRALEIAAKELPYSDAAAKAALAVGQALAGQRRLEAAEPYFKQSLAILERSRGSEAFEYAVAMQQYARFLRGAKRSPEANAIETRAAAVLNRVRQTVDVSDMAKRKRSR
jgi:tetratricopeptide (TPR) repeat protein